MTIDDIRVLGSANGSQALELKENRLEQIPGQLFVQVWNKSKKFVDKESEEQSF